MMGIEFSRRGLLATGVGSMVAALPIAEATAAVTEENSAGTEPKDKIAMSEAPAEATSYIPGIIEFEIWSA